MERFSRPWGEYQVVSEDSTYKVKRIVVNPSSRISYQSHSNRNELWVVVQGRGRVTLDDREDDVGYNSIISIPAGSKHRIQNVDDSAELVFIEIQTGSSFSESDIIRYDDDFGRT